MIAEEHFCGRLSFATAKKMMALVNLRMQRDVHYNRKIKEIKIDESMLMHKFHHQKGLCHWSNLPLQEEFNYISKHPEAISIDRLDGTLGYTYQNIVLVRRMFNLGRSDFSSSQFSSVMNKLKEEIKNA